MSKIENIYSLKELHDLLKSIDDKSKINIVFDFDLTLVIEDSFNKNIDILIEPEETKDLFSYISKHNIFFFIVTARFYDTVCNKKKRNLQDIKQNIDTSIFPILEELGLDIAQYKEYYFDDKFHIVENDKGKCVGILYRGIFFGDKKGEIIKYYRKQFGFDKSHPITIFVDDHDPYLKNVERHNPEAIVLRRQISDLKI